MKKFIFVLVALAVPLGASVVRADSDWKAFAAFADGYYYLNDQALSSLTCRVSIKEIDDFLKELRTMREKDRQFPEIKENLSEFTMTYRKDGSVAFNRPTISIDLPPAGSGGDNDRVRSGAQMIKNGFNQTVEGTVQVLEGVMESLSRPVQAEWKILEFTRDGDTTRVLYEKEGHQVTAECRGNQCIQKMTQPQGSLEVIQNYEPLGKLKLIKTFTGNIKTTGHQVQTDIRISYQDLGGFKVPLAITGTSKVTSSSSNMEGNTNIGLSECVIEK